MREAAWHGAQCKYDEAVRYQYNMSNCVNGPPTNVFLRMLPVLAFEAITIVRNQYTLLYF